jgi:hypothetical protein
MMYQGVERIERIQGGPKSWKVPEVYAATTGLPKAWNDLSEQYRQDANEELEYMALRTRDNIDEYD